MTPAEIMAAAAEAGEVLTTEEAKAIVGAIDDIRDAFEAMISDHGPSAAISAVLTLADEIEDGMGERVN